MKPIGNKVLIKQDEAPEVKTSQTTLITTMKEIEAPKKPNTGIIISMGDEVYSSDFSVGDRVEFGGFTVKKNEKGEEFLLVSVDSLMLNLSRD